MGCTSSVDSKGPNQIRRTNTSEILKKLQPIDHQRIKMVLDYWYGYSGYGNTYDLAYLVSYRSKALPNTNQTVDNQKHINVELIENDESK